MKATTKGDALLNRFDALEVALELIKALKPLIAKVGRHSRKEAAQLEDADVLDAMALDDRVLAMTWRLTH